MIINSGKRFKLDGRIEGQELRGLLGAELATQARDVELNLGARGHAESGVAAEAVFRLPTLGSKARDFEFNRKILFDRSDVSVDAAGKRFEDPQRIWRIAGVLSGHIAAIAQLASVDVAGQG